MKNIKTKILISLFALISFTTIANAEMVPGVSISVEPQTLKKDIGDTFYPSVIVKTPGDKVYAVEGTLVFDGLSCQSIMVADGLMAQSAPTCAKPYFLVGVPSGTATDKAILRVAVTPIRSGDVTLGIYSADVIGAGVSLSNVSTGAVYTIEKNTQKNVSTDRANDIEVSDVNVPADIEEIDVDGKEFSQNTKTQLATVAEFVADNSVIFSIILLLAIALGYRYVVNRRKDNM